MWRVVFVLLGITDLLGLVWLGDGGPGDSGLATFSVVTIALALAALILAPAIYLLCRCRSRSTVPHGLKKAVAPKLAGKEGRGFVKVLLSELEGALGQGCTAGSKVGLLPSWRLSSYRQVGITGIVVVTTVRTAKTVVTECDVAPP